MDTEAPLLPLRQAYCHFENKWLSLRQFDYITHVKGRIKITSYKDGLEIEKTRNIEYRLIPQAVCKSCKKHGYYLGKLFKGENQLEMFK